MEEKIKLLEGFPQVSTAEWEAQIMIDLKGADYEKKLIWKTYEGIPVKPYYRAESTPENIQVPFVPGNWEIRQDIAEEDIDTINAVAREISAKGAEGLGLNCSNVRNDDDLSRLLHWIDLEKVTVHFTDCHDYTEFLLLFINYLSKHGIDKKLVKGSLNYDPFAMLLTDGKLLRPLDEHVKEAATMLNMAADLPGFKILSVNGRLFHEAGSAITQELAYSLGIGHEYLYNLTEAGISPERILGSIQIILSSGSNYFMEIAKLRAIRILWAQIAEEYGQKSAKLHLLVSSSHLNKTLYDPYVNLLRSTTEAMSAAIGGADVIQIDPYDIVFRKPDEFSMRIARNQQIIMKEESWLNKVIDPSAGSYYIENLTYILSQVSWQLFKEIENAGGFQAAYSTGSIREKIEVVANQRLQDIANRKVIVLGTNQYPNSLEKSEHITTSPSDKGQHDGLRFFRLSKDFENLRQRTEKYVQVQGKPLSVFLLTIGSLTMRKARAMFATNFFGCAGFKIIDNPGFGTVEEAVDSWKKSGAEILVICSSDEEYPELVPQICQGLREQANMPLIILAGYPKEHIEQFKEAGIKDFIHIRSNVSETLSNYQNILGM